MMANRHQEIFKPDLRFESAVASYRPNMDVVVAVYNSCNYSSAHEADISGALYPVSFSLCMYGSEGLGDLVEIMDTLNLCFNGSNDVVMVVLVDSGHYIELSTLLEARYG